MRSARIVNAAVLGNVLRTARLQRGLSQRELAETLGISQRYVVEIERGRPTKALERIFDFMRETGVVLHADVSDE
ncbi:helix-turn-helix domain-containing protein [Glaciibacter superstes]|uniref:helix-turn-helix domain-containing protein n=1 Tax=Glaciibacter superstes TaxID=501023 RepID=UPI0003B7621A|nr:helix-turn-helix transcriptional regulator [Glaciibacter superstes]